MDSLSNEVLGMILDELKPRSLFDEFDPGFRRNIKSSYAALLLKAR